MTDDSRCGWNTGTASRGPSRCGKPAKARTNHPATNNGLVCGIHARVVSHRNRHRLPQVAESALTPLTGQEKT